MEVPTEIFINIYTKKFSMVDVCNWYTIYKNIGMCCTSPNSNAVWDIKTIYFHIIMLPPPRRGH